MTRTPLVIRRDSKSKVQAYWQFRSCRCILIHAAIVTCGSNGTAGGWWQVICALFVDQSVDRPAERIADLKPAHVPGFACRAVPHHKPERTDVAQRLIEGVGLDGNIRHQNP